VPPDAYGFLAGGRHSFQHRLWDYLVWQQEADMQNTVIGASNEGEASVWFLQEEVWPKIAAWFGNEAGSFQLLRQQGPRIVHVLFTYCSRIAHFQGLKILFLEKCATEAAALCPDILGLSAAMRLADAGREKFCQTCRTAAQGPAGHADAQERRRVDRHAEGAQPQGATCVSLRSVKCPQNIEANLYGGAALLKKTWSSLPITACCHHELFVCKARCNTCSFTALVAADLQSMFIRFLISHC